MITKYMTEITKYLNSENCENNVSIKGYRPSIHFAVLYSVYVQYTLWTFRGKEAGPSNTKIYRKIEKYILNFYEHVIYKEDMVYLCKQKRIFAKKELIYSVVSFSYEVCFKIIKKIVTFIIKYQYKTFTFSIK